MFPCTPATRMQEAITHSTTEELHKISDANAMYTTGTQEYLHQTVLTIMTAGLPSTVVNDSETVQITRQKFSS